MYMNSELGFAEEVMATPNYKQSRDEIEIEKLWQKIDELDDEICDRENKKREI